jgi:hypothetical protein
MQYKRREGGGNDEELAEEKPQSASMAARFRNPSKRRVSGDFLPKHIAGKQPRDLEWPLCLCALNAIL